MRDTGRFSINVITTPWSPVGTNWTKPWKNAGGDFKADGVDTFYFYDAGLGWNRYDVTAAVQEFVKNPSNNYGLMITVAMDDPSICFATLKTDTVFQLAQYHGVIAGAEGDAANKQYRPKLTVKYTTGVSGIIGEGRVRRNLAVSVVQKGTAIKLFLPSDGLYSVSILSVSGQLLGTRRILEGNTVHVIELPGSSAGVFLVRVTNAGCKEDFVSKQIMMAR